jgi:microtubule-associated protein-like 6
MSAPEEENKQMEADSGRALEKKKTRGKEKGAKDDQVGRFASAIEQSVIPEGIKINPATPDADYEVEYVYGYRTFDCRQNLKYTSSGKATFMAAALGVILDPETNKMQVYGGVETKMEAKGTADDTKFHMDDILSLDISLDRKTIVTGQVGYQPSIHVWDAETCEQITMFRLKEGSRGVSAIAISPCQRYVTYVDLHNDHHVGIFNIKKGKELLYIEGSKDKISHVQWSKMPNDLRFVTVGERDIKFWNPADASKRLSVKGTFGTKGKQTSMTCCTFDDEGFCYSAGANGYIMVWDQNSSLERTLKAHAGEVGAIVAEGGKLISGGKDNKIVIYNNANGDYTLDKVIDFDSSYPKAIDFFQGKILVGLRNGSILEINAETEEKKSLLSSHHEGEAWGLHIIHDKGQFLTVGDDNKLMLFDYENMKFIRKGTLGKKPIDRVRAKQSTASTLSAYPPNQQGRAIAHNPVNDHVAVSNNMGKVTIRHIEDLDTKLFTLKDAQEWCETIRYSP